MSDSKHTKWSRIEVYAGGLDVPLNMTNVHPRLVKPIIDLHVTTEEMRNALGSRERQLLTLKQMGLKSRRHE